MQTARASNDGSLLICYYDVFTQLISKRVASYPTEDIEYPPLVIPYLPIDDNKY
ncbi:hypothetical protein PILCRDRAFT_820035 [Piloderma croceum F 1598]|uniref:Uncharacterized protein n=1 Tax=Piloderma croceum (strain F 1598) TaxID=765440 RepID=A0A0C3FSS6_PILCF|nr:hypothetical protein PILCRDRAFT_820035 [Piloderma croceum F 1598]